jgi:hypothetical protein
VYATVPTPRRCDQPCRRVVAINTRRSWCTRPTPTSWFPARRVGAAGFCSAIARKWTVIT